ncbi:DUF1687-domain-containing protein [Jackrogersella minutella]|nr:DUF1687-domain-containing protein [Jackrogersella minutella]
MFRFHKPLDIVTLFHKSSTPASTQIAKFLKEVSANATAIANETEESTNNQASSHPRLSRVFELNITETPPTVDQLRTILDYANNDQIPQIIEGATTKKDAILKFKQNASSFGAPIVVDWHNGKTAATGKTSEILKMLEEVEQEQAKEKE